MDILEYINRMNRLYGTEPLAPWDKPEVPWDEAKAPPRYNTMRLLTGGRVEMKPGGIVEPGVTHYGDKEPIYAHSTEFEKKALAKQTEAEKIVSDYKKLIFKDSQKGNLNKTPSFTQYLKNKLGKSWAVMKSNVDRYGDFNSLKYLQEQKLSLTKSLVNEANKNLKFNGKTRDLIIEKIGTPAKGIKAESLFAEEFKNILNTLDKRQDKVTKALDNIVDNNLPIKRSKMPGASVAHRSPLPQMINEISNVSPGSEAWVQGLKNSKHWNKEFETVWKNMNNYWAGQFENTPFNKVFEFAKERVHGKAILSGDTLKFYKDPHFNVTNYIFRHWDRNNFRGMPSRVKLYDNSKLKMVDGKLVPKGNLKLKDIELKWESGKKFSRKDFAFSYDGSELFDQAKLITEGKESKLFNEVYRRTKDYNNLIRRRVPDPKNPGQTIDFGEMMTRDHGKGSITIGHNAPGGIKADALTNLQIQSEKMNTALYNATKNIKDKSLQKKVVQEIYGDLHKLKGDRYIEAFIKNPPNLTYKEAAENVLRREVKTLPTKQVHELANILSPESRLNGKKVIVASTLDKFLTSKGVDICG